MTSPEGGFYTATDADSKTPEGKTEEGYFFTWELAELQKHFDQSLANYYGLSKHGNFEGRNILYVNTANDDPQFQTQLLQAKQKLYQLRQQRPQPHLDDKVLTSWNALMISAFARSGFILDKPEYINQAITAANLILTKLYKNGILYRTYKNNLAKQPGFLTDYAFFTAALIDLYEATHDIKWLQTAFTLDGTLEKQFEDTEHGGYYLTAHDAEKLLTREKPAHDSAIPSGNAIQLMNLLRFYQFTTDEQYQQRAQKLLLY